MISSFSSLGQLSKRAQAFAAVAATVGTGLWVVGGGGGLIAKSLDGNVWTPAASKGSLTTVVNGVAYGKDDFGDGLWVAAGPGGFAKSTDGNVWSTTLIVGNITTGRGVAYGKDVYGFGLWIAVGNGFRGIIMKSTNGNVWTETVTDVDTTKGGLYEAWGRGIWKRWNR